MVFLFEISCQIGITVFRLLKSYAELLKCIQLLKDTQLYQIRIIYDGSNEY